MVDAQDEQHLQREHGSLGDDELELDRDVALPRRSRAMHHRAHGELRSIFSWSSCSCAFEL
jgi:hypothetical protein